MKAKMDRLRVTRTQHRLLPDPQRVILRPYLPGEEVIAAGRSRVGLVLDLGCWWLARSSDLAVYGILVGGALFAGAVVLMLLAILVDLWR